MTYKETLDYLFVQVPMFQNIGAGAYKPGLDTTLALAEHWDNPHRKLKTIHVGGTNGKGSTASTLAAVLQAAGYKVGLYTSPHLVDFRERIRVNGVPVPQEFVVDFVEDYLTIPELTALKPTFFELTTIMAFSWFAESKVDVAIVEVGLGGRLDCTNIITPLLSIITNISLDHTALLGSTEAEIASEKAGIIKSGVPVVVGAADGDVLDVFKTKAKEVGAPLTLASEQKLYGDTIQSYDGVIYKKTPWGDIKGELCGDCQRENTATVLAALQLIAPYFPEISSKSVSRGFADVCRLTGLAGRWMVLCDSPVKIICDTGHNVGGWTWLGPTLAKIAEQGKLHMVLGFVNDKDVTTIMRFMPGNAIYYFAKPGVNRGREASSTAEIAATAGLHGSPYDTVEEAFMSARNAAIPGDTIFVGGSTFVVADLLSLKEQNGAYVF